MLSNPSPFGFAPPATPTVQTPFHTTGVKVNQQGNGQGGQSTQDDQDLTNSDEDYEFKSAAGGSARMGDGRQDTQVSGQTVNLGSPTDVKHDVNGQTTVTRPSDDQEENVEDIQAKMTPEEWTLLRREQELRKIRAKYPWFEEGMAVPYSKLIPPPIPSDGAGRDRGLRLGPEIEVNFTPLEVTKCRHDAAIDQAIFDILPRRRRTEAWAAPALKMVTERQRARARESLLGHRGVNGRVSLSVRPSAHSALITDRKAANRLSMVELSTWEDHIAFGPVKTGDEAQPVRANKKQKLLGPEKYKGINRELESEAWLEEIVWGATEAPPDFRPHRRDMDEALVPGDETSFEEQLDALNRSQPVQDTQRERAIQFVKKPRFDPFGNPLDYLNLSKDYFYLPPKGVKVKLGQGAGRPDVRDAVPATRLDLPWYKPQPSVKELRSYHRPSLMFPTNATITFEPLAPPHSKTKREKAERRLGGKARKLVEVPQSSRELTLGDRSAGVLLEYSEQHPLAMSKYGMGAVICNYYRKEKDEEESIPSFKLGHPVVLPRDAAEPFPLTFLEPSSAMQSVENDLFRAPIFPHTACNREFLVIRQTTASGSRYMLKPIENLFVVGQTYPNKISVPVPGSREYTQPKKELLWNILSRAVQRAADGQINLTKIHKLYPGDERGAVLGRVKEVMVTCAKANRSDVSLFRLRTSADDATGKKKILSAEDLLKAEFLTPAYFAAVESADAAMQLLKDTGHGENAGARLEVEAAGRSGMYDSGGDVLSYTLERRLAPWRQHLVYNKLSSSTHIINGTRSQLVELEGQGDPTGRGDGFSLLMAGSKFAENLVDGDAKIKGRSKEQSENLRRAYREKQVSIWNRQRWSLVNTAPAMPDPRGSDSEEYSDEVSRNGDEDGDESEDYDHQSGSRIDPSRGDSLQSNGFDKARGRPGQAAAGTPQGEEYESDQSYYLEITRKATDGSVVTDYVTDERIWRGYIKAKVERGDFIKEQWKPKDGKYDARTDQLIYEFTLAIIAAAKEKDRLAAERKARQKGQSRSRPYEAGEGGYVEGSDGHRVRNVTCRLCKQVGHTYSQKAMCPMQNGSRPDLAPPPM